MTISILVHDAKTGACGGAATTGSLCVGGWVLRGDAESGLSASQGTAPSTLWGTGVLARMRDGLSAADAVAEVTAADPGRAHRQLAALDLRGGTGAFTGEESVPAAAARKGDSAIVTGNMLESERVLDACLEGYETAEGPLPERLLAALRAAERAGGDARGLLSAALLVVARDRAPLTLRIDYADAPLAALEDLYRRSQTPPYRDWIDVVPTLDDPHRAPAGE